MSKTAFIFPGQGSQFVGMGKELYEKYEIAKKYYDLANDILGFDLKNISFNGPEEELKQTKHTQPAIFVASVIIYELLKSKGYKPDFVAGHSLGEYSALVAAGVLDFADALEIVKLRGAEMQLAGQNNPGTMAAIVGLTGSQVIEVCKNAEIAGIVQAANFNSPVQTVISGSVDGVREAMKIAKESGAKIVKELPVSGAFHSPLMTSAVDQLKLKLSTKTFNNAEITVIPNVTAQPNRSGSEMSELLVMQVTAPVKWTETILLMQAEGVTNFVEVGPGKVLQGLVKSIFKEAVLRGVGTVEEIENF